MDEEKKIKTRDGDWNHADEMVTENFNRNFGQYCIPSVSRIFFLVKIEFLVGQVV